MNNIFCITGLDGTGKSTLIKKLGEEFPFAYISNIWDLFYASENTSLFKSKKEIDNYICSLTPDSRTLFLMHALKFSIDKAIDSKSKMIIADSYFYKYLASERALGANKELINSLKQIFPIPELIIELRLPAKIASERKSRFSRYECGLSKTPTISDFIMFQEKAKAEWGSICDNNTIVINSESGSEDVFLKVKQLINAKIA